VTSVNPDPNKFLFYIGKGLSDSGSGTTSGVLAAVDACVAKGAKIISMSLGGGSYSTVSANTFLQHYNNGVLIVAAAGNGGNSALSYPASYPAVMSIAAVDSNMNKASFSQWNSQVEISGPGVSVKSTIPGGYDSWSGTSMATPHVSTHNSFILVFDHASHFFVLLTSNRWLELLHSCGLTSPIAPTTRSETLFLKRHWTGAPQDAIFIMGLASYKPKLHIISFLQMDVQLLDPTPLQQMEL